MVGCIKIRFRRKGKDERKNILFYCFAMEYWDKADKRDVLKLYFRTPESCDAFGGFRTKGSSTALRKSENSIFQYFSKFFEIQKWKLFEIQKSKFFRNPKIRNFQIPKFEFSDWPNSAHQITKRLPNFNLRMSFWSIRQDIFMLSISFSAQDLNLFDAIYYFDK